MAPEQREEVRERARMQKHDPKYIIAKQKKQEEKRRLKDIAIAEALRIRRSG